MFLKLGFYLLKTLVIRVKEGATKKKSHHMIKCYAEKDVSASMNIAIEFVQHCYGFGCIRERG